MKKDCDIQRIEEHNEEEDRAPTSSSETTMSLPEGSDVTESSSNSVVYENVTTDVILALTGIQDQDGHKNKRHQDDHAKSSSDEKTTTMEQEKKTNVPHGHETVAAMVAPMPPECCFGEGDMALKEKAPRCDVTDGKEPPLHEEQQKEQLNLETAILTLASMEEAAVRGNDSPQLNLETAILTIASMEEAAVRGNDSSHRSAVGVGVPDNSRPTAAAQEGPPRRPARPNTVPGAVAVYPAGALIGGDLESAITEGSHQTGSNRSLHHEEDATDHHIVSATLVDGDDDHPRHSGHGDLVVEAKPALQGFAAIVRNERFKYVAAFFFLVLLAIVLPLALVLPGKITVEGEMVDPSLVCGSRLMHQSDYRGTKNVTENGRTCQNWADQVPHSHSYYPDDFPNTDLSGNSCRSMGKEDAVRAWCYTTDPDVRWEWCGIPFCLEGDMEFNDVCGTWEFGQEDYRGNISITATGKACQHWQTTTPHDHGTFLENLLAIGLYRSASKAFLLWHLSLIIICLCWCGAHPIIFCVFTDYHTFQGLLDNNFCRSPDGEGLAWCYTNEEETRWEYCDIPVCGALSLAEKKNNCTNCTTEQCGTERRGQADYRGTLNTTISGHSCMRWDSDKAMAEAFMYTPGLYPDGEGLEGNYCRNPTYRKSAEWYVERFLSASADSCLFVCSHPILFYVSSGWHGAGSILKKKNGNSVMFPSVRIRFPQDDIAGPPLKTRLTIVVMWR